MDKKGVHFGAKEELIRVIFSPINLNLRKEVGKSLIEVHEDGNLFVSFITGEGSIRIKLNEKRMVIYEWTVDISLDLTRYILKRFCLFLRRNDIGVLRVLDTAEVRPLVTYIRTELKNVMFESMGEVCYLELRVLDYLKNETGSAYGDGI